MAFYNDPYDVVLGTAENFVPRYATVFRLRTTVLYRGIVPRYTAVYHGIPQLYQNISNDVIFTNPYEGASDNNNETTYSVHFMYNHKN